jgi:hypothetical protein
MNAARASSSGSFPGSTMFLSHHDSMTPQGPAPPHRPASATPPRPRRTTHRRDHPPVLVIRLAAADATIAIATASGGKTSER